MGVNIEQKHALPGSRYQAPERDASRGFTHAAFLICYCQNSHDLTLAGVKHHTLPIFTRSKARSMPIRSHKSWSRLLTSSGNRSRENPRSIDFAFRYRNSHPAILRPALFGIVG